MKKDRDEFMPATVDQTLDATAVLANPSENRVVDVVSALIETGSDQLLVMDMMNEDGDLIGSAVVTANPQHVHDLRDALGLSNA